MILLQGLVYILFLGLLSGMFYLARPLLKAHTSEI